MLFETGERSDEIFEALRARKIFITHGKTWQMPEYLRVSYGLETENDAFFAALGEIV